MLAVDEAVAAWALDVVAVVLVVATDELSSVPDVEADDVPDADVDADEVVTDVALDATAAADFAAPLAVAR